MQMDRYLVDELSVPCTNKQSPAAYPAGQLGSGSNCNIQGPTEKPLSVSLPINGYSGFPLTDFATALFHPAQSLCTG